MKTDEAKKKMKIYSNGKNLLYFLEFKILLPICFLSLKISLKCTLVSFVYFLNKYVNIFFQLHSVYLCTQHFCSTPFFRIFVFFGFNFVNALNLAIMLALTLSSLSESLYVMVGIIGSYISNSTNQQK